MKRRKDNGEPNLKIYRGKIVKVNTESETSMSVDPITTSEPGNITSGAVDHIATSEPGNKTSG